MKSDRLGNVSRMWKRISLTLIVTAMMAIAALWIASCRSKVQCPWHAGGYLGNIAIDYGTIQIDAYRDESEDDFYWQRSLPLRDLEAPLMLVAAGLIWHMRSAKSHRRAPGFEVCV